VREETLKSQQPKDVLRADARPFAAAARLKKIRSCSRVEWHNYRPYCVADLRQRMLGVILVEAPSIPNGVNQFDL
jgi:hypothetical protein